MAQPANVVNVSMAYLGALLFAGLFLTVPGGRVIIYVAIAMACVLLGLWSAPQKLVQLLW
jgi:hypothetical protein